VAILNINPASVYCRVRSNEQTESVLPTLIPGDLIDGNLASRATASSRAAACATSSDSATEKKRIHDVTLLGSWLRG
jgi:hypothetical protein